ncbi:hypothetical protein, partial [Streptomyces anthocyanicus]|uniref:hypothetical protein n=1 Tax=Streptomyces anthocyanicus TaxID=68174 RepID=UPI00365F8AED
MRRTVRDRDRDLGVTREGRTLVVRRAGPYADDAGSDRVRGDDGGEGLRADAEQQGRATARP